LTNSVADMNGAAPFDDGDRLDVNLQLEKISSSIDIEADRLLQSSDAPPITPGNDRVPSSSSINFGAPMNVPKHCPDASAIATTNPLTGEQQLDISVELDAILTSLQLTTPHPPQQRVGSDVNSLTGILTEISTTEPVTHIQQSIAALNEVRQQSISAQTQLQILHQRNQVQVDRVDAGVREVKQAKSRTKQLAQQIETQCKDARAMLDSLERIHADIIINLDKFGGYAEIQGMLVQLETTRNALTIAHERVTNGEQTFHESLQAIEARVVARSDDSESKLRQYQESIESLSQTISTDRLQIAGMSVDMSTKLTDLYGLSDRMTTMHAQIVEKSQTFHTKIAELDLGLSKLSQSVRNEQEQFYALTVETIEKADVIRSQLADIIKQVNRDRDSISVLKAEIESVKCDNQAEIERQLRIFHRRENEIILLCTDIQARQKERIVNTRKLSIWLWGLSVVVGVISILLIKILFFHK
jgi:phosphopantetheine adenylyltransferase